MAGNGNLTALIFCSLLFTSMFVGYFVTEMQINEQIPKITLPEVSIGAFSSQQNFITGDYNENTIVQNSGIWENIIGVGYKLISGNGELLIDNINFNDAETITNTYIINNSAKEDYAIVIVHTGGLDGTLIKVANDGFHIVGSLNPIFREKEFIKYTYANQFTHPTITTTYNKNTHSVAFSLNSASFYTEQVTGTSGIIEDVGFFERKYGGVYSSSSGFSLESFTSLNALQSDVSPFATYDILWSVLSNMILLTAWTLPESIFPFALNVILIKSQVAALIISLGYWARG